MFLGLEKQLFTVPLACCMEARTSTWPLIMELQTWIRQVTYCPVLTFSVARKALASQWVLVAMRSSRKYDRVIPLRKLALVPAVMRKKGTPLPRALALRQRK